MVCPPLICTCTCTCRYLFNCGEGTQRLTAQLGLSRALSQLEHVFVTRNCWANLGGLPGMCLSARSSGAPDVTVHGAPGCMELYHASKAFLLLFEFDVLEHKLEDGPFQDGAVEVRSVVLEREAPTASPAVPTEWEGLLEAERREGGIVYQDTAIAFVCSFSPKPGRLDFGACVELGVPPGPLLGRLKAGQDVTLPDGTVVRAAQVVGEAAPPAAYMVVDVPDELYLPALAAAAELREVDHLHTVFHFSPPEVMAEPQYRAWMAELGPSVSHVLINSGSTDLGLPDVSVHQHKLRRIRPDLFPALAGAGDFGGSPAELAAALDRRPALGLPGTGPVLQARTGMRVNVRPWGEGGPDLAMVQAVTREAAVGELELGCPKLPEEGRQAYREGMREDLLYASTFHPDPLATLASRLKAIEGVEEEAAAEAAEVTEFPAVTMLGTGSSVPSKYRNVTGILVEVEEGVHVVLDCGEGTLGQLVRLRGYQGALQVLRGLRAVYVSHQHADHHLGLVNLILVRLSLNHLII